MLGLRQPRPRWRKRSKGLQGRWGFRAVKELHGKSGVIPFTNLNGNLNLLSS
jgi:hypothetical protein